MVVFIKEVATVTGSAINAAMKAGFTQVGDNTQTLVATVLPIGLGIMGVFMAIRLGIGFFRSIAN